MRALLVLPALIYWLLLDFGIGTAILALHSRCFRPQASLSNYASIAAVWAIAAALIVFGVSVQVIGHRVFEGRQPALVDNPTHLLLGPMFVMAKLYIALGYRNDLAAIIGPVPQPARRSSCSLRPSGRSLPHT